MVNPLQAAASDVQRAGAIAVADLLDLLKQATPG